MTLATALRVISRLIPSTLTDSEIGQLVGDTAPSLNEFDDVAGLVRKELEILACMYAAEIRDAL